MSLNSTTSFHTLLLLVFCILSPLAMAQSSLDERLVQASPDVIAADPDLSAHMQPVNLPGYVQSATAMMALAINLLGVPT